MKRTIIIALVLITLVKISNGQTKYPTSGSSIASSAVPFVSITPDSRAGAMGDAGVATSPDVNAKFWNPAKYVFAESTSVVALSYSPWLRKLVNDMNLAYLAGYHQLDKNQSISGSLRYFDLGSMELFGEGGASTGSSDPNEFSLDFGYSRKLSDSWSGSVAMRYIRSDIYNGTQTDYVAGNSFAADVAFYYNKKIYKNRKNSSISGGLNISNIGSKISYDNGEFKDFIPTNLRIGGAYTTELDKYNKLTVAVDLNKLLVPTPQLDSTGTIIRTGNQDVGPIEGMFISFSDAPRGFKEELREITYSVGAEYWYSNQFAVRTGYFHESSANSSALEDQWKEKGSRQYLTFGAGLKMNVFSLDFSYIVTLKKNNPLENTLRFTLGFDLDDFSKQGKKKSRRQ